ncbi:glycosyl transferase, partial [Pseudomonas fragi]|nr:glycosyl transferase [Pseudomonas sp. GC01]
MSEAQQHWAEHKERGSFWLMKLTAFGIKLLGRRMLAPVLYGIVLYFFVFG